MRRTNGAPTPSVSKSSAEPKFTLAEAFAYNSELSGLLESNHSLDLQKALLSIAFLHEWASDLGNEPVDGMTAMGLAGLSKRCAEKVKDIDGFYRHQISYLQKKTNEDEPKS